MGSLVLSSKLGSSDGQACSYPVRRFGHRILSDIPLEIYAEIFAYFEPPKSLAYSSRSNPIARKRIQDLCSLSLVCRLFRLETRHLIFTSVALRPDVDEQAIAQARESKTYNSFYRTLHAIQIPPVLIPHIRQCIFPDWWDFFDTTRCENAKAFLNKRGEALLQMTSLTSVTFFNTVLTSHILMALRDIPNLKSLSVECCKISSGMNLRVLMSRLKNLSSFKLLAQDETGAYLNTYEQLRGFVPLIPNLTELYTDSNAILSYLISEGVFPRLQTLTFVRICLTTWHAANLVRFLKQTPTLVSLTLDIDTGRMTDTISRLSLCDLPNLRHLSCPPHLVFWLIGTHNLSRLSFHSHFCKDDASLSSILSASNLWANINHYGSISELVIPLEFAFGIMSNSGASPTVKALKKFTVFGGGLDYGEDEFLKEFEKFQDIFVAPFLMELHFTQIKLIDFKSVESEGFVQKLVKLLNKGEYFPGLHYFSFHLIRKEEGLWNFMKECLKDGVEPKWSRIEQDEYSQWCDIE
ncbi:hypothetical protein GYMLUDRAFT_74818 [Collybiopsis luxurians FD-317 M1]|uniref:F-box domain-containing protein n=1 Tax=Collybiopsis luxurians FD-317 M1 TaxID=944289 RepID=A0A0D0B612_9AGAR|nr:hypothetical protein GYMLUDRAFT_74818 [Collybiopsis luxurians FD-317 M1]